MSASSLLGLEFGALGLDLLLDAVEEFDGRVEDDNRDLERDLRGGCVLGHESDHEVVLDTDERSQLGDDCRGDVLGVEGDLHRDADASGVIRSRRSEQIEFHHFPITEVPSDKRCQTLS